MFRDFCQKCAIYLSSNVSGSLLCFFFFLSGGQILIKEKHAVEMEVLDDTPSKVTCLLFFPCCYSGFV